MTWFQVELGGGRAGPLAREESSDCRMVSSSGGYAAADNPTGQSLLIARSTSGGYAANSVGCLAASVSGGRASASVLCRSTTTSGGRAAADSAGFANGYRYRRRLRTAPQADLAGESLTDLPWHVRGERLGFLASSAGKVTSASGLDIRLESGGDNPTGAGGTKLDHALFGYTAAAGPAGLRFRLPTSNPTAASQAFLYYGKAGAADEQNAAGTFQGAAFAIAWPSAADISGHGRGLTPSGIGAAAIDGLPGGQFSAASFARRSGPADLDGVANFTEEFWFQLAAAPTVEGSISREGGTAPGSSRFNTFVSSETQGLVLAYGWNPYDGVSRHNSIAKASAAPTVGLHHLFVARATGQQCSAQDGEAAVAATSTDAQAGSLKVEAGDVFEIGAGLGTQTTSVPMVMGLYTLWPKTLSPTFRAALHRSQADPSTTGIGAEEQAGETATAVAMQVKVTVAPGSTTDIDVAASAFVPAGAAAPTLSSAGALADGGNPTQGSVSVAGGKARLVLAGTASGTDRFGFTLSLGGGKTSSGYCVVTIPAGPAPTAELPAPLRTFTVGFSQAGATQYATLAAALAALPAGGGTQIIHGLATFPGGTLSNAGTAANPNVITMRTRLGSVLQDNLVIAGADLWVHGLDCSNKEVTLTGDRSRLLRFKVAPRIRVPVGRDLDTGFQVELQGNGCHACYGSFIGPATQQNNARALGVHAQKGAINCRVSKIYFKNYICPDGNAYELMDVGYSQPSTRISTNVIVEDILVEDILVEDILVEDHKTGSGEEESISIKSSDGVYRRITVRRGRFLSNRNGKGNRWERCITLSGYDAGRNSGMEIRDQGNKVINCEGGAGTLLLIKNGDVTCAAWAANPTAGDKVRAEDTAVVSPNFPTYVVGGESRAPQPPAKVPPQLLRALNTRTEANRGSAPDLDWSQGETSAATPSVPYVAPVALNPADVGFGATFTGYPS